MYTALYRAKRPEVFDEVMGQEHIVKILKHQIETDTVGHAYLFCGTRGTGKTTMARILAKAVNCLSSGERPCGRCANCQAIKNGTFMDVIEIDAASNNGVDNIRELRESVKYPPAAGRKKVYIIDEVHMLSPGASNALLKTLEEPPENVMFILATTEPQRLPATILSRCMRLDFKRVPQNTMAEGMKKICSEKGIEITDGAVRLLAANADGSVRDGLSVLEQVISSGDTYIDRDNVLEYIGTMGEDFFLELTELTAIHNTAEALVLLDRALADGKDVRQLMKDWVAHYRSLLLVKFIKNPEDMLNMSMENIERIRQQSRQISLEEINNAIIRLNKAINDARWSTQPRILLELAVVAIATDLIDEDGYVPPKKQTAAHRGEHGAARDEEPGEDSSRPEMREENAEGRPGDTERAELDKLWMRIFEEGEGSAGSFNLIRSGTELERMDEQQFVVSAKNDFTCRYVEQKREELERLMERHLGRHVRLVCRTAGENEKASDGDNLEEMAKIASRTLGVDVKIE